MEIVKGDINVGRGCKFQFEMSKTREMEVGEEVSFEPGKLGRFSMKRETDPN